MPLGLLRFQLALLVLIDHAGFRIWSGLGAELHMATAMTAVQLFFLVSGFYMAATYRRNYRENWSAFYLSRYLRLWPTYLFSILCAAILWCVLTIIYPGYPLNGQNAGQAFDYFIHFSEVPPLLNLSSLFMFGQDIISLKLADHLMLPNRVGWSIGAELAMYLLVPLVWKCQLWVLILASAAGFVFKYVLFQNYGFAAAYMPFYANIGYFLLGMAAFEVNSRIRFHSNFRRCAPWLLASVMVSVLFLGEAHFEASVIKNIALVTLLACTLCTARLDRENKLSKRLGDISYAVYLLHFSVYWFTVDYIGAWNDLRALAIPATLVLAVVAEVLLQKPLDAYRRQWLWSETKSTASSAKAGQLPN